MVNSQNGTDINRELIPTANSMPGNDAFFNHQVVRKFQMRKVRKGSQNQADPLR